MKTIRCLYAFVFYNEQLLDRRYASSLILSSRHFNGMKLIENLINYASNQFQPDLIKQRDIQQITFSGKMSHLSAARILKRYWQNPFEQGLTNVNVTIRQMQEYLVFTSK